MTDEWPDALDDRDAYDHWIEVLATNALTSARGQAADAEYTGDLADTVESRLESEVELEVDDKIDVLATKRTPYDALRLSQRTPTDAILDTLPGKTGREAALQLAFDVLFQDVLDAAQEQVSAE